MRVLVAYATKHGATAEVAQAIGEELQGMGFDAEVHPVKEVRDVRPFDAVLLGSAVYNGRWLREAVRFGRRHARELWMKKPVWLFDSGPIGDPQPKSILPAKPTDALQRRLGARDCVTFGGRLRPEDVDGFARRRVEKAAGTTHIFGDWRNFVGIRAWARGIGTGLQAARAGAPQAESLLVGWGLVNRQRALDHRDIQAPSAEGGVAVPKGGPWESARDLAGTVSSAGSETVVTELDQDSSVDLRAGDTVVVRLMETPETGFRWAIDTVDTAVLYLRRDDYVKDPDSPVEGEVLRNFEFVACQRGKCKLSLKLWDESIGEESVEDRLQITVRVR